MADHTTAGIDLDRDQVMEMLLKNDMLTQIGYRALLDGDSLDADLNFLTRLVQLARRSTTANDLDFADLDETAKEALRDLSHVENHLETSTAPSTIKNRAVDVRLCIKELRAAVKKCSTEASGSDGTAAAHPDGSTSTYYSEYEQKLENELATCRDLFPMPESGELHNLWSEACSDPLAVAAYVKAQFDAMNQDRAATSGSELAPDERAPSDALNAGEMDEMEAVARAAPACWYGTYQIVDGISDEKAVALIEACSPDTVLTLIAQARAAVAKQAVAPAELLTVGTLAWALIATNGNIIIWSRNRSTVEGYCSRYPNAVMTPIIGAAPSPSAEEDQDAKDAARWRETLKHVGGASDPQRFVFRWLPIVAGADILRGSVAEHFTNAIDAAIQAKSAGKEGAA